MGSSPFARTTKKEVTKVASFFCEVRSTLSVAQSIHPTAQRVPPVATAKRGNAYQFEKFGTGKGLLLYGICIRCKKQAPGVREAFSEAFGAQNRHLCTGEIFGTGNGLLWYGRDIRCGAGGRKTTTRAQQSPGHKTTPERTTRAQNDHQSAERPPERTTKAHRQSTRGTAPIML